MSCAANRYLGQDVSLEWLLDNPDNGPSDQDRMQALDKVYINSVAAVT
jgi:hypothetical protein